MREGGNPFPEKTPSGENGRKGGTPSQKGKNLDEKKAITGGVGLKSAG